MAASRREQTYCPECGKPKAHNAKQCAGCAKSGITPERRSEHALCGARKKGGGLCRKYAGEGTDHGPKNGRPGTGKCRLHGGATISHIKSAVAVEATRRMITLGQPIEDITATTALLGLLRATSGHVEWIRGEIAGMDPVALTTTHDGHVLTRLYSDERDRLTRIAEACIRAGVSEAIVRMVEQEAALMIKYIEAAMTELRLTPGQRKALGPAMRKIAPLLEGAEPDTSHDERIAEALAEDYPQSEFIEHIG